MALHDYAFVTRWRIRGKLQEVYDVLAAASELPRWWPSVYLEARQIEPGDASGAGRVIDLFTKGWLPYTLRWRFQVTEVRKDGYRLTAFGDFEGDGNWSFQQDGDSVDVRYDWRIQARKPLLRRLSFLLKPVFSANHRWAMEMGEKSLQLELQRRRADSEADRAALPPPPAATPSSFGPWLVAVLFGRR